MALFSHLYTVAGYLFMMVLVVFFHELGHFIAGRLCGAKIDAFSVGFGPELFAVTDRRGTRWRVAAIPLGGYVKFHGELETSAKAAPLAEGAIPVDRRTTFAGKPAWQRAFIVVAGPAASILLAIVIFAGLFTSEGVTVLAPRAAQVKEGGAAAKAGFQAGDLITAINGQKIDSFVDLQRIVQESAGIPLAFDVRRGELSLHLVATPEQQDVKGPFGTARVGVLGLGGSNNPADVSVRRMGPVEAVSTASYECWFVVSRTAKYLGGLLVGRESVAQLSGPVRMVEVTDTVVRMGFAALLNLAAFYSVSIGFFNLLPIPPLDGGRLLLYAIEALRGRPLSERVQEYGFRIGIAVVVTLVICATYNDISRHFVS